MLKVTKLIRWIITIVCVVLVSTYVPVGQLPATAQSLTPSAPAGTALSTPATLLDDVESEKLLADLYSKAIDDALVGTLTEISEKLWAIATSNLKLIWQEPDKKQFRAVTWTSWNGYDDQQGSSVELTRDVWVTAVPELQEFCSGLTLDPKALTLRLEKYLGLPAHNGKTKFVEMWVNPSDVFRPCPDKEVDDSRCELDFPQNVDEAHKQWIVNQHALKGYPWTALGYTYDWGNSESTVGASEFVVRKGAIVTVASIKETGEYCHLKTS